MDFNSCSITQCVKLILLILIIELKRKEGLIAAQPDSFLILIGVNKSGFIAQMA